MKTWKNNTIIFMTLGMLAAVRKLITQNLSVLNTTKGCMLLVQVLEKLFLMGLLL